MHVRTLVGGGCAAFVVACSSPPKPPTVDDSRKRPVNVSEAVNLQICRSELSAAKIVLAESVAKQFAPALVAASPQPASIEANQVFVIGFPVGSAELSLSAEERTRLLNHARGARFIAIRGRTDAVTDSVVETRLARRRAEAAQAYLAGQAGMPPDGMRLSWQGAGASLRPGGWGADRVGDRRVEIEIYRAAPRIQVLAAASS